MLTWVNISRGTSSTEVSKLLSEDEQHQKTDIDKTPELMGCLEFRPLWVKGE